MSEKPISHEELFEIVLDFYDAFTEVMKKGTDAQKNYAIRSYNDVRVLLASKLKEAGDIDFKELEKMIERDTSERGQKMREMKEELVRVTDELDPFIKKIETKIGPEKAARIRKRRMERKLRIKS